MSWAELRRRLPSWQAAFIAAFVTLQVIGPMHYYCVRQDKHDERFAWRMFSPMRMLDCGSSGRQDGGHVEFTVDGAPVALGKIFHEGWITIARRGRIAVIEAMGQRLCELHPGKEVKVDLVCVEVDGRREQRGGFDLCKVPEI